MNTNAAIQTLFPSDLLNADVKARVDFFKSKLIDHEHLNMAKRKAISSLGRASGAKVVVVAGPSGVGKSTLARSIYKEVRKQYEDEMAQDRSMIPVLGINATPPLNSSFNWKDFYYRLLSQSGEILLDHKMYFPQQGDMFGELIRPPSESSTVDALRRSLERAIKRRNTKVLIVDEAHHILMLNDPKRLEFQFEQLKSLTIETDVTIVLVGTYRLLQIREHSGQLVRRSEIVPFQRYDFRNKNDAQIFKSVLKTFASAMPLKTNPFPNLEPDVDYFYMKSAGCVGILKEWLTRCLEEAILAGHDTIDTEFASRYALDNKGLSTIVEEALEGESLLEDDSEDKLMNLLRHGLPVGDGEIIVPVSAKNTGKQRRPGTRSPSRDKTGDHHAAR